MSLHRNINREEPRTECAFPRSDRNLPSRATKSRRSANDLHPSKTTPTNPRRLFCFWTRISFRAGVRHRKSWPRKILMLKRFPRWNQCQPRSLLFFRSGCTFFHDDISCCYWLFLVGWLRWLRFYLCLSRGFERRFFFTHAIGWRAFQSGRRGGIFARGKLAEGKSIDRVHF